MKFVQLILRKIIKIVATRCQILRLKCTKFEFGTGGAYSAPPDPLAEFEGPTSKGGKRGGEGGEGRGEEAFLVMWPRRLSALNPPLVSMLTRDIDIGILSVCLSVRLAVCLSRSGIR